MIIKVIKMYEDVVLPDYVKDQDAGFDIRSYETVTINPMECKVISTGLKMSIPNLWELQIRSRSGLAANYQVFVLNSPGTVDSGYLDEIKIILFNAGQNAYTVNKGDRIAQGVVAECKRALFQTVTEFGNTYNRQSGFGGTGIN